MKLLGQLGTIASLVVSIQSLEVKVYKFPFDNHLSNVPILDSNDAILNLANQFDISSKFDLSTLNKIDSLSLGQDQLFQGGDDELPKQELILIVQGVTDGKFLTEETPIYEVSSDKDFNKFLSNLPNEFDEQDDLLNRLSTQISLIESKSSQHSNSKLNQIWNHYFSLNKDLNKKLNSIWTDLKESFHLSQDTQDHSINLINDESFINELSQFKYLIEDSHVESKKIIINLKSLSEILKKTGLDSKTYQNSLNILSNLIQQNLINNVNKKFKSTIITLPSTSDNFQFTEKASVQPLHKRANVKQNSNCYISEESCLISTSSCSNHGVCAKNGECWSCNCAASYNDTTKATTYWQGSDCSKKDVSSEFNLILWFSVFMVVATILGVKLMFDVGNEELPGVLSAATASKKSNA